MKKISLLILIALMVIIVLPLKTYATGTESELWPVGPEVESASAVVIDVDSGTIVYDKAGLDTHYPASITKVMTALVAVENSSLDEVVTFSKNAVYNLEKGSSSISRDVDEKMTMEECLYGLLLESANEVATAIGEHVAGDIPYFAAMMNKKAAELGCQNTHFSNANGLHADDHYTCAYDMALIAREAYRNPTLALIMGTKSYTIPPTNKHDEPTPLNNHHAMLNYYRTNKYIYEYCLGGKTGYTSMAQSTLVTYAKKDDFTLACVVMCVPGSGHYVDTRTLMDFFLNNMQTIKVGALIGQTTEVSGNTISKMMSIDEVPYVIDKEATVFTPKDADISLIHGEFVPPDADSPQNILGHISYSYGGKEVGRADLIGTEVEIYPFMSVIKNGEAVEAGEKPILINVYFVAIIAAVVIVGIYLLRLIILWTNGAFSTMRRKRVENRDPHKNMRRIKRRRRKRSQRERDFM